MRAFLRRNLLVFFKDRAAVFFSLLSSLIILGLYILFLGNVIISDFEDKIPNAHEIMTNWIMAGLLAASTATTTLGGLGVMIGDKAKKIDRDLYVSPISRRKLALGYVLNAMIIGYILTFITLYLSKFILSSRAALISLTKLLEVMALILLATLKYRNGFLYHLVFSA